MATEDDEWELLLNGNRILVWGNEQIVEMDSGNITHIMYGFTLVN